jgi:energy-coupling factor transporter ATP-binding protein EcfA2
MPLPLIPVAIAAGVAVVAGGIALAVPRVMRPLKGKRIAVLGARGVGKTTLLQILRDRRLPSRKRGSTDPAPEGLFSMEVQRKSVNFAVPNNVSGNGGLGYPVWKQEFKQSDFVWYLFRADLIAQGDAETLEDVRGHLDMFRAWIDSGKSKGPKIILIGTFSDKAITSELNLEELTHIVAGAAPIKAGVAMLNNAGLVVGSLALKRDSAKLVKRLGNELKS